MLSEGLGWKYSILFSKIGLNIQGNFLDKFYPPGSSPHHFNNTKAQNIRKWIYLSIYLSNNTLKDFNTTFEKKRNFSLPSLASYLTSTGRFNLIFNAHAHTDLFGQILCLKMVSRTSITIMSWICINLCTFKKVYACLLPGSSVVKELTSQY